MAGTSVFLKAFLAMHASIFHRSNGKALGKMRYMHVLLLTTTGPNTGQTHMIPILYFMDGDAIVRTASNG